MVQDRAKAEAFVFYLSCDISSQVSCSDESHLCSSKVVILCARQVCGCQHALPSDRKVVLVQVHVRVDHLVGQLLDNSNPKIGKGVQSSGDRGAPALYVIGQLCAFGEVLGLPARAPIAQARPDGCSWGSVLSFPLKVGAHMMFLRAIDMRRPVKRGLELVDIPQVIP